MFTENKRKIKIMFQYDSDRYWKVKIMESPKAISYCKFKHNASLEKYLYKIKNCQEQKLPYTPQAIEPQSSDRNRNRKALETNIGKREESII